jgi:hypothetical protein
LGASWLKRQSKKARRQTDLKLDAAGWRVQNRDEIDLTVGRGVAVREFPMKSGFGFADYLLYLDRKAIGAIEAKAEGALSGVEAQSAKYAAGLPDNLPAHERPFRRQGLPIQHACGSGHSLFTLIAGLRRKTPDRSPSFFGIPLTI